MIKRIKNISREISLITNINTMLDFQLNKSTT